MGLPVEVNNLMLGSLGGYTVGRSLRFRSSASAYLSRTPASASNRTTWTWSGWVKRSNLGAWGALFNSGTLGGTSNFEYITFRSDDTLQWVTFTTSTQANLITTQVFRDPSAWYHIVVAFDSTQATSTNRVKMYINGVQVTAFGTSTYPSLNYSSFINNNQIHTIGRDYSGDYFDGYLAEVNFIDGQALTPSSFGAYDTNGVWQPKKYSGTYGTNGFYLPFSNTTSTTTLVQDSSGNGNNWTPNNISLTAGTTYDSMIDSPTNSASSSNYAVLNPLDKGSGTISDGNLTFASLGNMVKASIGMSSGKWYWEINNPGSTTLLGISSITDPVGSYVGSGSGGYSYGASNGNKNNNATSVAYGATFGNTDTIGVAFDADAGNLTFYKNNTSQGTAFSSIPAGTYFPALSFNTGGTTSGYVNFGQRPFTYTPPSGYKALNTYNLPAPSIANGAQYMAATTYSGTSATQNVSNAVNGVSFQPDFAWIKVRSTAAYHALVDSLRVGTGGLAILSSNATDAEWTSNLSNYVTGFNSNGIALGNQALTAFYVNRSGDTYVGWQWKGGGTGVTNTSGSITSTVSANTTAGFSVVTYTGTGANATVGHGLGVAPSMIIIKNRQAANSWVVYHVSTGNGNVLLLNSTNASTADSTAWNTTTPTSSVFSLGSGAAADTNQTTGGGQHVAYCFAAVRGYSAFGSYTGNGSTDGPFCYTGFRPRWVMIKNSSVVSNWFIFDTSRDTYNIVSAQLQPNTSAAEQSGGVLDVLSNGFKLRDTTASVNGNGNTITFAAFAENPFNISRAR